MQVELELLHIRRGDKKKKIDTSRLEGRNEIDKLLKNLRDQKYSVLLDQADKTYRVVGYDPVHDELIVQKPRGRGYTKDSYHLKLEDGKAHCRVDTRSGI